MNHFFWVFLLCWLAGWCVGSVIHAAVPRWLTDL